jgi:UDP-glucose 4-epimerase
MKVLVTGGAGFIGSHIVEKLIEKKYQVTIIDNLSTGLIENVHSAAKFFKLDIVHDDLNELFAAERFDYIIHEAAQTSVPHSLTAPDYDCQVNVMGTLNVLEAARKTGVKRIVFASSAAVYGNVAAELVPVVETCPLKPMSFYGLSKTVVEQYLRLYAELYGLEYVILRYANVYGDRQGDAGEGGVVSIFARKYLHNQPITIFGDGGQTRDFIYAGDVAEANCQALSTDFANTIYNISTCTEVSVNELADTLAKVTGRQVERRFEAMREGDIYRSALDNTAGRKGLNWQPRVGLSDGLAITYDYLAR